MIARTPVKPRPRMVDVLRAVQVGLREDLEVSRHLFRGEPTYVVRDPLTFHSQRLDLADYGVFISLSADRSLQATFTDLVSRGKLTEADEEAFYQFVLSLHQLGFLRLPIADDKLLYRRYHARQQARRRARWTSFLFLRVPLWNPDAFLERTIHLFRPFFSRTFFMFWLMLMAAAGYVAAQHWHELAQPIEGILVSGNLPLIWLSLIVLKGFHEMGHAYACKHYGGHVPELGMFLILFTPCAYMDASASWGFTRRRERIIVCLGGMYVEATIAAIALFVWAATDSGLLHALAYNVIFLASVVTVLFNINPLMRFDGYFIASDLVEIPNLRQRSSQYVLSRLKCRILGIPQAVERGGRRLHAILLTYGVSIAIYRVGLMLAIAALLAHKMYLVGFALGVLMLGGMAFSTLRKLTNYLWHSEEAAPKRRRAIALSFVVLIVIPSGLLVIPVPSNVRAAGLVGRERETVIRAKADGFLAAAHVRPGDYVETSEAVVRLGSDAMLADVAEAKANLRASKIRSDAFRVWDPARAQQEAIQTHLYQRRLRKSRSRLAELEIRAPHAGRLIDGFDESDIGRFVRRGDRIATVVAGCRQVRAVLTEEQMARVRPRVGDTVELRGIAGSSMVHRGTVRRIVPVGSREIDLSTLGSLTHIGGGDIPVDAGTSRAMLPYFGVTIDLEEGESTDLKQGMLVRVRFAAKSESVGTQLGRRFARFWNRMLRG